MFRTIPNFSKYEINEDCVIRNRATGKIRKPLSNGTIALRGDDKVTYNRTVNSLMRKAGFISVWIDPEGK